MAGAPIKWARREIIEKSALRAAHEHLKLSNSDIDKMILRAYEEGEDPVLLALPVQMALHKKALEGDVPAIKEWNDRVGGKVESTEDRGPVGVTVQILNLLTTTSVGSGLPALAAADATVHKAIAQQVEDAILTDAK